MANTRDGLAAARARGRNGGRRPKLNADQVALAQRLYDAGEHTVQQIADIFGVPRTTVYGHLNNATKGKRNRSRGARCGSGRQGRRDRLTVEVGGDRGGQVVVQAAAL